MMYCIVPSGTKFSRIGLREISRFMKPGHVKYAHSKILQLKLKTSLYVYYLYIAALVCCG